MVETPAAFAAGRTPTKSSSKKTVQFDTRALVSELGNSESIEGGDEGGIADSVLPDHVAMSSFRELRTRYPGPFADRLYVYATRVWDEEEGGGTCYNLSRKVEHPGVVMEGRVALVPDYM